MQISNKFYDLLRYVALIGLPASAVLVLGVGQQWTWEYTDEVVGTIVLVDTFLGSLLQLSTNKFNKSDASHDGFISATGADPDTGIPNLKMTITSPPEDLLNGNVVRLKVGTPPAEPDHE